MLSLLLILNWVVIEVLKKKKKQKFLLELLHSRSEANMCLAYLMNGYGKRDGFLPFYFNS